MALMITPPRLQARETFVTKSQSCGLRLDHGALRVWLDKVISSITDFVKKELWGIRVMILRQLSPS